MKITAIKGHAVSMPLPTPHCTATSAIAAQSQIVVEVRTDEGVIGYGTLHGRNAKLVLELLDELDLFLKGDDALAHEAVWAKVFGVTTTCVGNPEWHKNRVLYGSANRAALLTALAGVDIALWDIKGKAANLPVYRLLGGTRKEIFAYVTGGYYEIGHEHMAIVDEVASYVELGFRGVKIKIGGYDLATDVMRVEAVREAIGPETLLMVDANCAYDLEQATAAIRAFEPYNIFWFEEPIQWYDTVRAMGRLALRTHVALASGESEMHSWACRDLVDLGGIRYMMFDATRWSGATEWLRVAAYSYANGVQMAAHHDPHIHGHLISAVPNGFCVETFPNAERDPLWDCLYTFRAQLRNGALHLGDEPGFGFGIDWKAVERYRM
jgi:L-alanine-DL-glutamate epimerase-like enolase superfamily enzyme